MSMYVTSKGSSTQYYNVLHTKRAVACGWKGGAIKIENLQFTQCIII